MMGDYDVVYRKGTTNATADALSRRPQGQLQAITFYHSDLFDKIKQSWSSDPSLVQLIKRLQQDQLTSSKYAWQNDQLRRKDKLVVGADLAFRIELLQLFHCSPTRGHSVTKPTMAGISSVLY